MQNFELLRKFVLTFFLSFFLTPIFAISASEYPITNIDKTDWDLEHLPIGLQDEALDGGFYTLNLYPSKEDQLTTSTYQWYVHRDSLMVFEENGKYVMSDDLVTSPTSAQLIVQRGKATFKLPLSRVKIQDLRPGESRKISHWTSGDIEFSTLHALNLGFKSWGLKLVKEDVITLELYGIKGVEIPEIQSTQRLSFQLKSTPNYSPYPME